VSVRPPADGPAAQPCAALHRSLPEELDGRERRETSPASQLTTAWGDPAVVLRCGVDRPAALTATSEVLEVDGVEWFLEERPAAFVFTTVGRTPYVQVRVPTATPRERAVAPLVDLAGPVEETLPRG
jgi:hypothetical protein